MDIVLLCFPAAWMNVYCSELVVTSLKRGFIASARTNLRLNKHSDQTVGGHNAPSDFGMYACMMLIVLCEHKQLGHVAN